MSNIYIPSPLDQLVSAVNSGDLDHFLRLLHEDCIVDDWGTCYKGKQEIRTWSDRELIGAKGVMTIKSVAIDGGAIHLLSDWKSTFYTGPGRFVFDVQNGRIKSWKIRAI